MYSDPTGLYPEEKGGPRFRTTCFDDNGGPGPKASRTLPKGSQNAVRLYSMNVKNTVPSFQNYYNNISIKQMDEMVNKNYESSLKAYDTAIAQGIYGLDDSGDIAISEGLKDILWNESVQKMFNQIKDNWVQHETGIDPNGIFKNITGIGNGYWLIYRAKAVTSNSEAKAVIAQTAILSGTSYLGGNYNFSNLGKIQVPVYRVYGGGSSMYGKSYSLFNPQYVPNYRNFAGLPDVNSGEFLLRGNFKLKI